MPPTYLDIFLQQVLPTILTGVIGFLIGRTRATAKTCTIIYLPPPKTYEEEMGDVRRW